MVKVTSWSENDLKTIAGIPKSLGVCLKRDLSKSIIPKYLYPFTCSRREIVCKKLRATVQVSLLKTTILVFSIYNMDTVGPNYYRIPAIHLTIPANLSLCWPTKQCHQQASLIAIYNYLTGRNQRNNFKVVFKIVHK